MEVMKDHRIMPRVKELCREEEINRICEKNRAVCNRLTDLEREDLLNRAMQRIYGSRVKAHRASRS